MKWLWTILLFPIVFQAQGLRAIDSLNNLPYETKSNRAASLDVEFLKNAQAAKKVNYAMGEADSYSNLGLVYYYQGKYWLNVAYQQKAIALYEKLGAREKLASEYAQMGYMMKRRDMVRAQRYMVKGKSIAESGHFDFRLAGIYDNYGVLKEMQNQLDSAEYFYQKGLRIKERLRDSVGIPYSLNNLAGVYVMRGQFSKAEPLYAQSLVIREKLRDTAGMSENYGNLGAMLSAQKHWEKAVDAFEKSRDLALAGHYLYGAQSACRSLADAYENMGRTAEAYQNFKLYSAFRDSLVNTETNQRIAELDVRYETSKKEKLLAEQRAQMQQRSYTIFGLCIIALFLIVTGYLLYRQQSARNRQLRQEHELKAAIAEIETQRKLQDQRLEISRDLHDNIGSQLTFIISSVDNTRYAFDLGVSKLGEKLQHIGDFTRDTIVELRDTIWAMNHSEITFDDLQTRMLGVIEKARTAKPEIKFHFAVADVLRTVKLTSVQGMNLFRVMQEAVNNTLKYADAAQISIDISQTSGIEAVIADNGIGFDQKATRPGNGMGNMRRRIEDIGGRFSISSVPGKGTTITLYIPFDTNQKD